LYQEAFPHWLPASAFPVEITAPALNATTTIANALRRDRHACIVSMFPSSQSATSFFIGLIGVGISAGQIRLECGPRITFRNHWLTSVITGFA